ncbi:MAG: response regulator transcription factor [Synechococcaceae cyanobacterium]|nr:response regulator transcription factor [Synechococcaceae cyanobacterium]
MDLTPLLATIPELLEEYRVLLDSRTIVACLGNMKWLGAFMCITPITEHIVGAATTEAEGYRLVLKHQPDFLIVSDQLHEGSGLSLVRRAEQLNPDIRTILVASQESPEVIRQGLAAGCDGIVYQNELFTPAFRVVAGGGVYYPREAERELHHRAAAAPEQFPPVDLTPREIEILANIMLGLSNRQIAEKLHLSPETVKSHVSNVVSKLGARDRTHAAVLGIARGIVSLEDAPLASLHPLWSVVQG